ncbi:hypothetical protein ABID39_000227 [Bartonella japonica]|uniref:Uncharacterized protein n=1 Tax=Bartonella japonica TaxID=357761 RepID=A0ABV2FM02_9HYPH
MLENCPLIGISLKSAKLRPISILELPRKTFIILTLSHYSANYWKSIRSLSGGAKRNRSVSYPQRAATLRKNMMIEPMTIAVSLSSGGISGVLPNIYPTKINNKNMKDAIVINFVNRITGLRINKRKRNIFNIFANILPTMENTLRIIAIRIGRLETGFFSSFIFSLLVDRVSITPSIFVSIECFKLYDTFLFLKEGVPASVIYATVATL